MLKNNRKIHISNYFLISMVLICLLFATVSITSENAYAGDLNESADYGKLELTVQDKQGNSLVNDDSLEEINSQGEIMDENNNKINLNSSNLASASLDDKLEISQNDDELQANEYRLNGGTFADIQNTLNKAHAGDTIILNGYFYHDGSLETWIKVKKQLTITSETGATLDGLGKYHIMGLYDDNSGTVVRNINFVNAWGGKGSALRVCVQNALIEDCKFLNNHHTGGGALSTDGGGMDLTKNLIVRRCEFTGNNGYMDDLKMTSAGAIGLYGWNAQVIDCVFDSNWVKADEPCFGGAIQVGVDDVYIGSKIIGCTFKNNKAISTFSESHGGAGCVRDGVDYINCIFINNQADQGGALTMHASGSIVDCKFYDNVATSMYGGAISSGFLYTTMILNINNCYFEGNSAPEGGAIQAIGLNVSIFNSNFVNNNVTGSGGAISIQALNVNVSSSNFEGNLAEVNGGAIYIKGENTNVFNSKFISNNAVPDVNKLNDGLGGAIYVDSPKASIYNNEFKYNTARNGSAIYYEKTGQNLVLTNNILFENQAWVYGLPIDVKDIYYEDSEEINVIIFGGNNIADYDNLAVSNAIYNAAENNQIAIDGQNPLFGATMSGDLYQDGREYNIPILVSVSHEDGTMVYEDSLNSSYLGEISITLDNLKPGLYYVTAKHFEDTYYKQITNVTSFRVIPRVDNKIVITTTPDEYNFEDVVKWVINITNYGPNNATGVVINNLLPDGLIYYMDSSGGLYDPQTGILNVSTLNVGEVKTYNMITIVNKTGVIVNEVNITATEIDTDLSNNDDSKAIQVNQSADISVSKTVNNTHPNYKDYVNWTITIRNNGPDTAHNITIQDLVPQTLKLINYTGNYDSKRGLWHLDSLEFGDSITFNLITQVETTGILQNNVYAEALEFDYDFSNNRDDESVLVDPSSDLSIIKTVNASEVNYLNLVTWTLTISNNGPDDASGVVIVDVLPEGFIYINSTHEFNDGVINIGNLSAGERMVINITCEVDITGNHTNYANISGSVYDYNLTNNEDSQEIFVFPASDLEITKEVNETEPMFGDFVEWTIVVVNNGPDVANTVIVNDKLPEYLIYVEDDSEGEYNPESGIWNITRLEVDEEVYLMIITKVNGTGNLANHVNVTSGEYDYDLSNNEYEEFVEVPRSCDVGVIKLVNNTAPNYLDLVKWTIIAFNKGPDEASEIVINEKLPDGLILVNATASSGIYENSTWSLDSLKKDETQSLVLICKVNKTGNITNNVSLSADEYDPNSTDNEANESIDVPLAVDIEVTINADKSYPLFGDEVVWTITIKNNGPDNATAVQLVEILPDSLIFVGYNSTKGNYSNGNWNLSILEVGGVEYLNITTIVNKTGIINNRIQATAHEYDWNMSNNHDNTSIDVLPVTDLAIKKTVNNPAPNYLDEIIWTLKITNNGPNNASNVVVIDNLPDGVEFIKSSGDYNYNNGRWYVGNLENGEIRQLDIVCRIISTGLITNNASVEGEYFDPNLDNNEDNQTISVRPASDLAVYKIASKSQYVVGDIVKYTIRVVNNGLDAAYNVKISEILDKSLILKSFKASKGRFSKSTLVWTIDCLENGESAVLTINVIANASGVVENAVIVTSDSYDYNTTNNEASEIINVSSMPENVSDVPEKHIKQVKPSIIKTANPIAVLIISLMSCVIFVGGNITKKR